MGYSIPVDEDINQTQRNLGDLGGLGGLLFHSEFTLQAFLF